MERPLLPLRPLPYLELNKRPFLEHQHLVSVTSSDIPFFFFVRMEKPNNCIVAAMGQTSFFGQPQQQQAQQPAFGTKQIGFGQAATSTTSTFGFGQAAPQQQQASIFGQPQQAKPFGTSIFGPPTTSQPAPSFGTQAPATGFGFGTPQQVHPFFLLLYVILFLMAFLIFALPIIIDSKPFQCP